MQLRTLIGDVESRELTLTVYNADPDAVAAMRERFADRNVVVEGKQTPSGDPSSYVTLRDEEGILSSVGLSDLQSMLDDPTITGLDVAGHRPVLDHLSETLFTSWKPTKMLTATREIEDRAWRVGDGRLFVGFQNQSVFRGEATVYERLTDSDLDIHIYVPPNGDPVSIDGVTVHVEDAPEIEQCWFLAYDGGSNPEQACALFAEERSPREYYGFWTYDPETVDLIIEHLSATYDRLTQ